jgi:hypothetical protein
MSSGRQRAAEGLRAVPVDQRDAYLTAHSGLPGPRANLELLQAAADVGDEATFRRWLSTGDEYLAACGAVGIGRLIAAAPSTGDERWDLLRDAAGDQRWRVREGVAMALQRVGDADTGLLLDVIEGWAGGPPLLRRAAVAGIAEPRLLAGPAVVGRAVALLETATAALLARPDPRDPDARTLRQALGYAWSVVIAAGPDRGLPAFARLAALDHPDARWIVRENRKKKRLQGLV